MDIRMPRDDGLEATRRLASRTRVPSLTSFDQCIYEALRAGASGLLLKDAPADQLVTAIRGRGRRARRCSGPSFTRRLIEEFPRP